MQVSWIDPEHLRQLVAQLQRRQRTVPSTEQPAPPAPLPVRRVSLLDDDEPSEDESERTVPPEVVEHQQNQARQVLQRVHDQASGSGILAPAKAAPRPQPAPPDFRRHANLRERLGALDHWLRQWLHFDNLMVVDARGDVLWASHKNNAWAARLLRCLEETTAETRHPVLTLNGTSAVAWITPEAEQVAALALIGLTELRPDHRGLILTAIEETLRIPHPASSASRP